MPDEGAVVKTASKCAICDKPMWFGRSWTVDLCKACWVKPKQKALLDHVLTCPLCWAWNSEAVREPGHPDCQEGRGLAKAFVAGMFGG